MVDRYLELQWPSRRIPPGGVLHSKKSNYSPEVRGIMKVLMDESKLTMSQRRQVDWCLRSGSCLPDMNGAPERDANSRPGYRRSMSAPVQAANYGRPRATSRKRMLGEILESGVFEKERYRPNKSENREKVKERLQDIMEFGRDESKHRRHQKAKLSRPQCRALTRKETIHELLVQIKDRAEWLEEMEALGDGPRHRDIIHHQIAERIKKINELNEQMRKEGHEQQGDTLQDNVDEVNRFYKDDRSPSQPNEEAVNEMSLALSNCTLEDLGRPNHTARNGLTPGFGTKKKNRPLDGGENISDIMSHCFGSAKGRSRAGI